MKLSEIREASKKIHDQCAEIYNSTESVVKMSNEKREKLEAEQAEITKIKITDILSIEVDIINLDGYVKLLTKGGHDDTSQCLLLNGAELLALRDKLNEIL